jgi:photosystem II stability/assembly factor-like uncharacterized protein
VKFPGRNGGRPDDRQVVDALRASLHAHARQAPRGGDLAERVLAAVDEPAPAPLRQRRARFTGWAPPLVAAASVAAIAATAVVLSGLGGGANQSGPQPGVQPARSGATVDFGSGKSGHRATPPPSALASRSASAAPPLRHVSPSLRGLRLADLTFAGTNDGWALGTADCVTGVGRCTALLRTHDGRHWTPVPGAAFNVPGGTVCADPCVEHLRFANDKVGYAFGDKALFMTTDGGRTWQLQPGGALALETLNGNVVRVTFSHGGCPGPCDVGVETAPIGSSTWTRATLPGPVGGNGVAFDRQGDDVYLLSLGHVAGGGNDARSTLFRSTDDGRTWQQLPEPCPQSAREVDSTAIAAGADGRASVLCLQRNPDYGRMSVAVSGDAGSTWHDAGALPGQGADRLVGDPATVLLAAGMVGGAATEVMVSHDGGATWQPVKQLHDVSFVGFESWTVGRAIAANGRQIWTTRDAGRTWHRASFG